MGAPGNRRRSDPQGPGEDRVEGEGRSPGLNPSSRTATAREEVGRDVPLERTGPAMTRLRHDVDFVTTVALLATVVATALTGVIADLWDLNDFWYHTVSGYAMGVFAAARRASIRSG